MFANNQSPSAESGAKLTLSVLTEGDTSPMKAEEHLMSRPIAKAYRIKRRSSMNEPRVPSWGRVPLVTVQMLVSSRGKGPCALILVGT